MGIYASVSIVLLVKPDKVNLMSSCWMYFPKLSSQIVFEMCIQKFPGSHKCQFYWKDYLNWYKEYCRRKCTLSCSFRLFQFETDYLMTLRYINLVFVRNIYFQIIHWVIWGWWIVFIVRWVTSPKMSIARGLSNMKRTIH